MKFHGKTHDVSCYVISENVQTTPGYQLRPMETNNNHNSINNNSLITYCRVSIFISLIVLDSAHQIFPVTCQKKFFLSRQKVFWLFQRCHKSSMFAHCFPAWHILYQNNNIYVDYTKEVVKEIISDTTYNQKQVYEVSRKNP